MVSSKINIFEFINESLLILSVLKLDRVCDTVVELQESKQHRDECVNVPSLVCTTEERTVFEKVNMYVAIFLCSHL